MPTFPKILKQVQHDNVVSAMQSHPFAIRDLKYKFSKDQTNKFFVDKALFLKKVLKENNKPVIMNIMHTRYSKTETFGLFLNSFHSVRVTMRVYIK